MVSQEILDAFLQELYTKLIGFTWTKSISTSGGRPLLLFSRTAPLCFPFLIMESANPFEMTSKAIVEQESSSVWIPTNVLNEVGLTIKTDSVVSKPAMRSFRLFYNLEEIELLSNIIATISKPLNFFFQFNIVNTYEFYKLLESRTVARDNNFTDTFSLISTQLGNGIIMNNCKLKFEGGPISGQSSVTGWYLTLMATELQEWDYEGIFSNTSLILGR